MAFPFPFPFLLPGVEWAGLLLLFFFFFFFFFVFLGFWFFLVWGDFFVVCLVFLALEIYIYVFTPRT